MVAKVFGVIAVISGLIFILLGVLAFISGASGPSTTLVFCGVIDVVIGVGLIRLST